MSILLDLTNAIDLRIANVDVKQLRIADTDIWTDWQESRRNIIVNPNFATSATTGWTSFFSPSRVLDPAGFSGNCIRLSKGTGSSQGVYTNGLVGTAPGDVLHGIARVKAPVGQVVRLTFKNSSGDAGVGWTDFTGDGTWQTCEIFYTVPGTPSASYQLMVIVRSASLPPNVGDVLFWLDTALSELNTTGPFFDGASAPPDAFHRYEWTGTPNNSASREMASV